MDHRDIRTLQLLEELEKNHSPSQRELARQLNISLGLVNSFIKRLAKKGYFKITTIPKNRVKYILTPKGAAEKTRLTYEYIKYSFELYKSTRRKLRKLFYELGQQGAGSIVFYGAGDLAEIAYLSLQETPIHLLAIVDDLKIGKRFIGFTIAAPETLPSLKFDRILITSIESKDDVITNILDKGISRDAIVTVE